MRCAALRLRPVNQSSHRSPCGARARVAAAAVPNLKSDGSVLARLTRNHALPNRPARATKRATGTGDAWSRADVHAGRRRALPRPLISRGGGGARTKPTSESARALAGTDRRVYYDWFGRSSGAPCFCVANSYETTCAAPVIARRRRGPCRRPRTSAAHSAAELVAACALIPR